MAKGSRGKRSEFERQFNDELARRVKYAREQAKMTQDAIANVLQIDLERYKKYEMPGTEARDATPIPVALVDRFCIVTRRDPLWLMTGREPQRNLPKRGIPFRNPRAPSSSSA